MPINTPLFEVSRPGPGLTMEMRRFSASMRVITALLCTALFFTLDVNLNWRALGVMVIYSIWSAWLLWIEASGRTRYSALWTYWIDVTWSCLIMKLWSIGAMMMVFTLVHPVVLATIGYGIGQGLLLALFALLITIGSWIDNGSDFMRGMGWRQTMQALLLLSLVPAAALVARPMGIRLRWLAVLDELEAQLDARRGLDATCTELAERLRNATQANAVALVLPSRLGAPAMVASRDEACFRTTTQVHVHLEGLLSQMPNCPMTYVTRRWWDPRPGTRLHADLPLPDGLPALLAELARTLDVYSLHVVPLTRYAHHHGHLLVGYCSQHSDEHKVASLTKAAPELLHIIERATLADQLQEESACHERARIGRDLHDSAIQPYLGLKYAVESVALRIPVDNPARAELDSLAELVNSEVFALRELISGLRTGYEHGDNTLVPAVRRQVRRFSLLFGIDVEIDCPDTLATTRAMASSLFHMVNELLNNIRKHTVACRVWISLSIQASSVYLVVQDDAGSIQGHPVDDFRPASLIERTTELKGSLRISRPDSLNTQLVIQIPL